MRFRLLALLAGAILAAVLAGCAEGPYYDGPYYSSPYYGSSYGYYDYDYYPGYYYGPSYYYGSPGYLSFNYYRGSDSGHHWNGSSRSVQSSVQTQSSTRIAREPRVRRSNTTTAHASRHVERHAAAARQPSHVASQTRTGPDREHGG